MRRNGMMDVEDEESYLIMGIWNVCAVLSHSVFFLFSFLIAIQRRLRQSVTNVPSWAESSNTPTTPSIDFLTVCSYRPATT